MSLRRARRHQHVAGNLLLLTDLTDFGLHQRPRLFADGPPPIAIEMGADQSFAEALDIDHIDDHAAVAERLLKTRIGGADEGALLSHVTVCVADDRVLDIDRKSTRLNSSHQIISYAVFCLK